MIVKKSKGRVYGAELTASERQAMNLEIQRQLKEYDEKHEQELAALTLWVLRTQDGWGQKRLKRFFRSFAAEIDSLAQRYQLSDEDKVWLCTRKLKEDGIDIAQWYKEL